MPCVGLLLVHKLCVSHAAVTCLTSCLAFGRSNSYCVHDLLPKLCVSQLLQQLVHLSPRLSPGSCLSFLYYSSVCSEAALRRAIVETDHVPVSHTVFSASLCRFCAFSLRLLSLSSSLQQSLAEGQHLRAKALASPTQEATGFLLKDSSGGGGSSKNSSCDTDDFVMVPAHFNSEKTYYCCKTYKSNAAVQSPCLGIFYYVAVIAFHKLDSCRHLFDLFPPGFPAGELACESKVLQDSLMNSR